MTFIKRSLLILATAASLVMASESPSISTRETTVAFDAANGNVAHLIYTPVGRDFIAAKPQPLFTLTLVDPAAARLPAPGVL